MRLQAKNRLVMTKDLISARLDAGSLDQYAWVWVSPLRDGSFKVSTVKVPKTLVDDDVCFFEDDIERTHIGTVSAIADVDAVVSSLGVDPDDLDAPWHNGFPL